MKQQTIIKTGLLLFSVFVLGAFTRNYLCLCGTWKETGKNMAKYFFWNKKSDTKSNCCQTNCSKKSDSESSRRNLEMAEKTRTTEYPILDIIKNRWSPRAMSGETITKTELFTLFEAARWAASSYNNQPERFIYATRDSKNWERFLNLLVPFNQMWAKNAGALIVVVSKNSFDHSGEFMPTHSFDTGAACANMALQGSEMGLVVHGMGGFDYNRAKTELNIPEGYAVEAMFAIGKPGNADMLPEQLRGGETPSGRKAFAQIACEDKFNF